MSRFDVWLDKTGQAQPKEENAAMHFGKKLEQVVADEFAERNPRFKVRRNNSILQHPEHPMFLANVDRLLRDPQTKDELVLEIKTTSAWNSKVWQDGRAPDSAVLQCQWYMGVGGWSGAYLAALIGGQNYVQYEVPRDDDLIAYIQQIALEFWRLVESQVPPEPDGSDACTKALEKLYKSPKGDVIELPSGATEWLSDYDLACGEIKKWEAVKSAAENKIRLAMGDNVTGCIGDRKASWPVVVSNKFDTTRFRKEHPELYGEYTKPSVCRRLTIS
jgi:putative phage-type endonuclease